MATRTNLLSAKTGEGQTVVRGFLQWTLISSENNDQADIFYCDQFLWEMSLLPSSCTGCKTEVLFTGDKTKWHNVSPDELKGTDRNNLRLHFVPRSVETRFNGLFSTADIQCGENVAVLKIEKLKNRRYFQFLSDWDYFLRDHRYGSREAATKESIISFAMKMRNRYSNLFTDDVKR